MTIYSESLRSAFLSFLSKFALTRAMESFRPYY